MSHSSTGEETAKDRRVLRVSAAAKQEMKYLVEHLIEGRGAGSEGKQETPGSHRAQENGASVGSVTEMRCGGCLLKFVLRSSTCLKVAD